jgi:hypothetical protein
MKIFFTLVLAGALLAGPAVARADAASSSTESVMVAEVIDALNDERVARGLPALPASHELNASAQSYAERWPTIPGCETRPCHSGAPGELIYLTTGELPTSAAVHWWMSSTGHREAILGNSRAIGVGIGCRADGGYDAVVHLGDYSAAGTGQPASPMATPSGSGSTCSSAATTQETTEPPRSGFADVPGSSVYSAPVRWAAERGISAGCTESLFCPSADVTRAQAITLLWRRSGSPSASGPQFADVDPDSYYATAVRWARRTGVVRGCDDDRFCPDAPTTRSQFVSFLWESAGAPSAGTNHGFDDIPAGAGYEKAVTWAAKNGVTNGTSATAFSPDLVLNRGQAVMFLHRHGS